MPPIARPRRRGAWPASRSPAACSSVPACTTQPARRRSIPVAKRMNSNTVNSSHRRHGVRLRSCGRAATISRTTSGITQPLATNCAPARYIARHQLAARGIDVADVSSGRLAVAGRAARSPSVAPAGVSSRTHGPARQPSSFITSSSSASCVVIRNMGHRLHRRRRSIARHSQLRATIVPARRGTRTAALTSRNGRACRQEAA